MTTALATLTDPLNIVVNVADDAALLGDSYVHVDKFTGWYGGGAGVRRTAKARMISHGQFVEQGYRDAALYTLEGIAWASSRAGAAALVDRLAATLADGSMGSLTVNDPDMGARSAAVTLYGAPKLVWDSSTDIEFTVDMLAPDPRKFSPQLTASTGTAVNGGALNFSLFGTGILDFGVPSSSGMVTLVNNGTAPTSPAFKVSGYAPGFTITRVANGSGARIVYSDTVPAGSYVQISSSTGTAMLDGYNDRSGMLTVSEFEQINGGESATYLFESPGNAGAALQLQMSPAWW